MISLSTHQFSSYSYTRFNGRVNLQEANLLENGCYHCNMHLKIGHGCEERHRKESYVVFYPQKYSHFALVLWKINKYKMNKMAYFSYLKNGSGY